MYCTRKAISAIIILIATLVFNSCTNIETNTKVNGNDYSTDSLPADKINEIDYDNVFENTINYIGIIDKYPIHMSITYKGDKISGSYYYDAYGIDIEFEGNINGSFLQINTNNNEEFLGIISEYEISGKWISEDNEFAFNLIEESEAEEREELIYINERLGYTVIFPINWKDNYIIEEKGDLVYVYFYSEEYEGKYGYEDYNIVGVPLLVILPESEINPLIYNVKFIGQAEGINYYSGSTVSGQIQIQYTDYWKEETEFEKKSRDEINLKLKDMTINSGIVFEENYNYNINISNLEQFGFKVLEEFSYLIELENFGEIKFVSTEYENSNGNLEYRFYLADQNDYIIYEFEENQSYIGLGYKLDNILFDDIDGDSKKDIIIIGTQLSQEKTNKIVNIYIQNDFGFLLDKELNDRINFENLELEFSNEEEFVEFIKSNYKNGNSPKS